MCEYCQYGSDLLWSADSTVKIDSEKCQLILVEETYYDHLISRDSQKINYCPVCGRKLEDQNDNNQNE